MRLIGAFVGERARLREQKRQDELLASTMRNAVSALLRVYVVTAFLVGSAAILSRFADAQVASDLGTHGLEALGVVAAVAVAIQVAVHPFRGPADPGDNHEHDHRTIVTLNLYDRCLFALQLVAAAYGVAGLYSPLGGVSVDGIFVLVLSFIVAAFCWIAENDIPRTATNRLAMATARSRLAYLDRTLGQLRASTPATWPLAVGSMIAIGVNLVVLGGAAAVQAVRDTADWANVTLAVLFGSLASLTFLLVRRTILMRNWDKAFPAVMGTAGLFGLSLIPIVALMRVATAGWSLAAALIWIAAVGLDALLIVVLSKRGTPWGLLQAGYHAALARERQRLQASLETITAG